MMHGPINIRYFNGLEIYHVYSGLTRPYGNKVWQTLKFTVVHEKFKQNREKKKSLLSLKYICTKPSSKVAFCIIWDECDSFVRF